MTALPMLTATPHYLSRYVRRCMRCRQVRGNSAFPREGTRGVRGDLCALCTNIERNRMHELRRSVRALARRKAKETRLARELETVRKEMRAIESTILAYEQPELLETR